MGRLLSDLVNGALTTMRRNRVHLNQEDVNQAGYNPPDDDAVGDEPIHENLWTLPNAELEAMMDDATDEQAAEIQRIIDSRRRGNKRPARTATARTVGNRPRFATPEDRRQATLRPSSLPETVSHGPGTFQLPRDPELQAVYLTLLILSEQQIQDGHSGAVIYWKVNQELKGQRFSKTPRELMQELEGKKFVRLIQGGRLYIPTVLDDGRAERPKKVSAVAQQVADIMAQQPQQPTGKRTRR